MTIKTIAIVGAGPGGFRLVANLGLMGYRLRLNDIDEAKLTGYPRARRDRRRRRHPADSRRSSSRRPIYARQSMAPT